jgi:hypothetical protein
MCCRPAVERVFTALTADGMPERHAVEAAVIIYRYHHPEVPLGRAVTAVCRWTGHTVH